MDRNDASPHPAASHYPDPNHMGAVHNFGYSNGQAGHSDDAIELQLVRGLPGAANGAHDQMLMTDQLQSPDQGPETPHGLPDSSNDPLSATGDKPASQRSRPKSSRACDHCSSKKQGCKAPGKGLPCERCIKLGLKCEYKKPINKRGPSKGYIKNLEGRITSLEKTLPVVSRTGSKDDDEATPSRKRQRIDGYDENGQPRVGQHSYVDGDMYGTGYGAPMASMLRGQQFPLHETQQPARWNQAPAQGATEEDEDDELRAYTSMSWMDEFINDYYTTVHPFLPCLPLSKDHLKERLDVINEDVSGVFLCSLYLALSTVKNPNDASQIGTIRANAEDLVALTFDKTLTEADHLFMLQALLMVAIQMENNHELVGPWTATLAHAVSLAYKLRIFEYPQLGQVPERDSDADLVRRTWLCLVLVDRWQSASRSKPALIPEESCVLYPEDAETIGAEFYQLLRITKSLTHTAAAIISPKESTKLFKVVLGAEYAAYQESWNPTLSEAIQNPNLHLCNWSIQLLLDICNPDIDGSVLLHSAQRIINLMSNCPGFLSPMTHYAFGLAAVTLIELYNNTAFHEQAKVVLQIPLSVPHMTSGWDKVIGQRILDTISAPTTESLQQLAEAAGKAATAAAVRDGLDGANGADGAVGGGSIGGGLTSPVAVTGEFAKLYEVVKKGWLNAY